MSRVWVADTSSILAVRRCLVPDDDRQQHAVRRRAYTRLLGLAERQRLVFPKLVYDEIKKGHSKLHSSGADHPLAFIEQAREFAERDIDMAVFRELCQHHLVSQVVDENSEDDEADIYVLALAVALQRKGTTIGVLTEERRDQPRKLSLTTACGLLELVCLPMKAFLQQENIYDWAMTGITG